MKRRYFLQIGLLVLLGFIFIPHYTALSQMNRPPKLEIYRNIIRIDKNSVRNIRWMEMWERHNEDLEQREWLIADYRGVTLPDNAWNLETKCYHTFTEDDGVPIYMIDEAVVPVGSPDTLWSQLKGFEIDITTDYLISSLSASFTEAGCRSSEYTPINGQDAESCSFEGQDPARMFYLDPATGATSEATVWSSVEDSFPLRYTYHGEGQNTRLLQRYEATIVSNLTLTPPSDVGLMCFEEVFPLPENTAQQGEVYLIYAAFNSTQTINQINNFYVSALAPDWSLKLSDEDSTTYFRAFGGGVQCDLSMRFTSTPNGTVYSVEVFPSSVEGVPTPPGFPPIVSSPLPVRETMPSSPQAMVEEYLNTQLAQGASMRDELYFANDTGAFAVVTGSDGVQSYVMVEQTGEGRSAYWAGDLPPVCGPTFTLPR